MNIIKSVNLKIPTHRKLDNKYYVEILTKSNVKRVYSFTDYDKAYNYYHNLNTNTIG